MHRLNFSGAAVRVDAMRVFLQCMIAAALLLAAEVAGRYKGDCSSNGCGATGAIGLTIKPGPEAEKAPQATFTLSRSEVK